MEDIRELAAFREECEAAEATLRHVPPQAWDRPALGEWSLAELVAHLTRGADRLAASAERPPEGDAPACDRIGYWRVDLGAAAADVARRARETAAGVEPATWPDRFGAAWRASVDAFAAVGADGLVPTRRGPMHAVEYLATRVLEVCVHHGDVRAALDLPPAGTIEAERITQAILEGLLDGPRPRNLGRRRFIEVATGRRAFDDPRFPVLT